MRRARLNASILSWLRCFEAAARLESFTHAAAELCVTQGAVSQQVRELEDRLGMELFSRTRRQLVLTEAGKQLAEVATQALDDLEGILARLHRQRTEGKLQLSCYSSFALLWLMPRIGCFYRQHPQIDLSVSAEFHAIGKATLLREGIDAAIRYDLGSYPDLESSVVLDEYLLPVASPAFLDSHPELVVPADLDGAMLLHDATAWTNADEGAEWMIWLRATGADVCKIGPGRRFNLFQLALTSALDGQGVAMGRAALVLEHILDGRLKPVFGGIAVPSPAAYRLVHMSKPDQRVGAFGEWLRLQCHEFKTERDKVILNMLC